MDAFEFFLISALSDEEQAEYFRKKRILAKKEEMREIVLSVSVAAAVVAALALGIAFFAGA